MTDEQAKKELSGKMFELTLECEVEKSEKRKRKISSELAAILRADAALEKQIPKKIDKKSLTLVRATNEKLESHLYEAYPCPTCKDWVQKNYKCCQWCGQALDWSDTE